MVPLTDDALAARYGDRAGFEAEWSRALDALVGERWLLPDDADALRADISRSGISPVGALRSSQK